MEQTFKNYIVKDKVATPENPFVTNYGETFVEMTGSYIEWQDFEQWKQSNTYATDAPDGTYPKEWFNPIKQVFNWTYKTWDSYPNIEYLIQDEIETRDFLEFKQPSKQAGGGTVEEAAEKYAKDQQGFYGDQDIMYSSDAFKAGAQWQSTQFQEQLNELHTMLAKSVVDADQYNTLSLKIIEIKQSLNT
jgi:hypothetical protein